MNTGNGFDEPNLAMRVIRLDDRVTAQDAALIKQRTDHIDALAGVHEVLADTHRAVGLLVEGMAAMRHDIADILTMLRTKRKKAKR